MIAPGYLNYRSLEDIEGLVQDLSDVVLVRFNQLADLEGRVTAERRDVLLYSERTTRLVPGAVARAEQRSGLAVAHGVAAEHGGAPV
jgi:hypothetical protein